MMVRENRKKSKKINLSPFPFLSKERLAAAVDRRQGGKALSEANGWTPKMLSNTGQNVSGHGLTNYVGCEKIISLYQGNGHGDHPPVFLIFIDYVLIEETYVECDARFQYSKKNWNK